MKSQAKSSSEPSLKYKQKQTPDVGYDFLNQFWSYMNITQFQISSKRENRQRDT